MVFQDLKTAFSHHQSKFYKTAILFMYFGYWLFALSPLCKNKQIYLLYVLIWCGEISFTCYFAVQNHAIGDKDSLSGVVNVVLYFTHTLGHIIVLIESCVMLSNRALLTQQFSSLRQIVAEKLKAKQNLIHSAVRLCRVVMGILVLVVCGHGIATLTTYKTKSSASLLYHRSLQSYLALQFKTLEFLSGLLQLNYFIIIIRQLINDLGERNLKRVFKNSNKSTHPKIIQVVPLNEQERDELLLKVLKSTLNEAYVTFQLYKETYGWSLLFTTAVYFADFVCNSYWVLFAILTHSTDYYGILQNVTFDLMAFILLSLTCWYAEECYCESRIIGCLISKLVKPLGNKQYNDLVSEFSVQTLHQRFTITAKEFFTLNLSLLGKMVAAIVTYLVILIQFMLTENNKPGNTG